MSRRPLGGNITVGVVTNNNDPERLGRVKVKYPWLTEEHESWWARQSSQMAGNGRGMFNIPEVGDEVLLAFEHGDIHRPFIIGQLWNGKDSLPQVEGKPMLGGSNEVNRRGFYTRIGHHLVFDDTDGKGDITMKTAGAHVLVMDDANQKIQVTTTGNHIVLLDDQNQVVRVKTTSGHMIEMSDQANTITVVDNTGSNKLTISANDGSIAMECMGNFSIQAEGQVNIQGTAGVNISTDAMMNLSCGCHAYCPGGR